jgi:hypothetical protein
MPKQHRQKNARGDAHAQTERRILHVKKELVVSKGPDFVTLLIYTPCVSFRRQPSLLFHEGRDCFV